MKSRERQLLLEILLIIERYSSVEIESAARELKDSGVQSEIFALMQAVHHGNSAISGSHMAEAEQTFSKESLIENFVAQLQNARSSKSLQRTQGIARKLSISSTNENGQIVIKSIREKLQGMEEAEVRKFVRSYKTTGRPDEGYMGLAQYLIRSRKED